MPKKKISSKKAFELWITYGSLAKATESYVRTSGKKLTKPGLQYARDIWITKNPDKAKELMIRFDLIEESEWNEFFVRRLINVYRRQASLGNKQCRAFHRKILKHGLLDYNYLYEQTFGKTLRRTRNTNRSIKSLQK